MSSSAIASCSRAAEPSTIKLALVTTPSTWHSRIPRFTPSEAPKSSAFTISLRVSGSSGIRVVQQRGQDAVGVELLLGEPARRVAVTLVLGVHGVDRGGGIADTVERQQALAR